jgi:LPXTG-motif cell wall-anchored protein
MKRIATSVLSFVLVVGALAPVASADAKVVFSGSGSARALDLSLPLVNSLGLGGLLGNLPIAGQLADGVFKGLTVGVTSTTFASEPKASGFAIGNCSLLPANVGSLSVLPVDLPCINDAVETSSSSGDNGDGVAKCASNLELAVVTIKTSCANSTSKIVDGLPLSTNEGGVATVEVGLGNLNLLGTDLNVGATVDGLIAPVTGVVTNVLGTVNGLTSSLPLPIVNELPNKVADLLKGLNLKTLVKIEAGAASSNVNSSAGITTVISQAAGARVGLLGVTDALADGLIMVDVSVAKAVATWNDITGTANANATPAIATIKVKDLLDLIPGDYITADVDLSVLNGLLAPLQNTILDSGIELASATPAQSGNNVSASTTGVGIALLRGFGESSPGAKDGGIRLRVAAADVQIAGDLVKAETVDAPLPHTGGATPMFLAMAAVLAVGGAFLYRFGRKVQKSGSAA